MSDNVTCYGNSQWYFCSLGPHHFLYHYQLFSCDISCVANIMNAHTKMSERLIICWRVQEMLLWESYNPKMQCTQARVGGSSIICADEQTFNV